MFVLTQSTPLIMIVLTKGRKPTKEEVENFEKEIGNRLPNPYREMILNTNPITVNNRNFETVENTFHIHYFIPFKTDGHFTLEDNYRNLKDFYENNFIGFAGDSGGWQFVISIEHNENYGKVYFCRMDSALDEALTFLADSFEEFLNRLEGVYGIDKNYAHERARELVPEEFFWSCVDELAPFGSDEGDMALAEFRRWKKEYPTSPIYECLKWTIECVGEIKITAYNEKMLDRNLIKSQIEDDAFDDSQYISTLDVSVIAVGFGQLVDSGKIDKDNKPLIQLAIDRLKIWAELSDDWDYRHEYIDKLNVLDRVLKEA